MPRKLTKTERADLERQRDEIRWLMSDRRGRNVVWWLLGEAGIYQQSHTGDALNTAFREGGRRLGLKLHDRLLDADPGALIRLLQEHQPPDPETETENDDDRHGLDSDARG